jgi:ElaB/YqjD/DUF883 family membrane-anchored ribosome-binding protein
LSDHKFNTIQFMERSEAEENDKGKLRAKLEATVEKAKEVCERLQEQTAAAAKATDRAVRDHPYQAMGIAFGVGVLVGVLGFLAARRRRD